MIGTYLDTGFFIALAFHDDDNHERAITLFRELISGHFGKPLQTSLPVLIETAAMIHRAIRGNNKRFRAIKLVKNIFELIEIYKLDIAFMNEVLFQQAKEIYIEYDGTLDFVDALNVAYLRSKNIRNIVSFDSDYDKFSREGICRIN